MFVFFQSRRFLISLIVVGFIFYFKGHFERKALQLTQSHKLAQNVVLHDLSYQLNVLNVMLRIISDNAGEDRETVAVCDRLRAELLKLQESLKEHSAAATGEALEKLKSLRTEVEKVVRQASLNSAAQSQLDAQRARLKVITEKLEMTKKEADELAIQYEASSQKPFFKLFAPTPDPGVH